MSRSRGRAVELRSSFPVKICGVTRPEDAAASVELGADLLGLNFYPPSPRYLELGPAREIAAAVAGRVPLVGVFVNRPPAEVERLVAEVGLDLVQFHGDEPPEEVARFGDRAIRVFRRETFPPAEEIEAYPEAWGFLFDVPHETLYGGTGESWSYGAVARLPDLARRTAGRPVLLAGGIGPDNAAALRAMAQDSTARDAGEGDSPPVLGIDVCSGVESAPGVKDRTSLERLFTEVWDGQIPSSS